MASHGKHQISAAGKIVSKVALRNSGGTAYTRLRERADAGCRKELARGGENTAAHIAARLQSRMALGA